MDFVDIMNEIGENKVALRYGAMLPVEILDGYADDEKKEIVVFFKVREKGHTLRFRCLRDSEGGYYLPLHNAEEYPFRIDNGEPWFIPRNFIPGLAPEEKEDAINGIMRAVVPEYDDPANDRW